MINNFIIFKSINKIVDSYTINMLFLNNNYALIIYK